MNTLQRNTSVLLPANGPLWIDAEDALCVLHVLNDEIEGGVPRDVGVGDHDVQIRQGRVSSCATKLPLLYHRSFCVQGEWKIT